MFRFFIKSLFFVLIVTHLSAGPDDDTRKALNSPPPFFKGFDSYSMKISTKSKVAQKYFDQGLLLFYGYNFPEAARSFKEAARQDPNCAICYWGEALAYSECIKHPGDVWCVEAHKAIEKALDHMDGASDKEKDLIYAMDNLINEYDNTYTVNRSNYLEYLKSLVQQYPDDPDIAAIYVNWQYGMEDLENYMNKTKAFGKAKELIDTCNAYLDRFPKHPGLLHFNIHVLESCGISKKALESAKALDGLVPGSGHLQHMPAHIYFAVGDYHNATRANKEGIKADEALMKSGGIAIQEFAPFYAHNYFFIFGSLTMEGKYQESMESADKIVSMLKTHELPSNNYLDNVFYSSPYLIIARFGKWEDLANQPKPPEDLYFARAMRAYAEGLAAVSENNHKLAGTYLNEIHQMRKMYDQNHPGGPLSRIMTMTALELSSDMAAVRKNKNLQISELKKAVAIEDRVGMHMLPWYMPMRQALGAAYLQNHQPDKAIKVYKEDLESHPNNGWSLLGLSQAYKMQKKNDLAEENYQQFKKQWAYADDEPKTSRY